MAFLLEALLWAFALVLSIPAATLLAQVLLARRAKEFTGTAGSTGPVYGKVPRMAVLVPAHNEHSLIASTVGLLMAQLPPPHRLLVVADNCTDDTATLARSAGANVVERHDPARRGKGYALDFGVRNLAQDPPDVLLIVDADCIVQAGSLQSLATAAWEKRCPVQALYLMNAPANASLKQRVAAWAWRVKNWARPQGWHRCGWPCQLMGTGMAFPWPLVEQMIGRNALANGHLVEDMKLGADLALAGTPPMFCPEALVTSEFPTATAAQQSQRKRWEHGHLHVITSVAPRLLWQGIRRRHMPTVAMALDMLVPPVALLALLLALLWCAALGLVLAAGAAYAAPLVAASVLVVLFKLALWRAWWGWGRDLVSAREWLQVPFYLAGKLPVYLSFLFKRQKAWVRTDRK